MALRAQLSRDTLAALFAELVRQGWIRTAGGIEQFARDTQHWRNLLTPDYRRIGPVYDVVLGEAAFGRLLPHSRPGLGSCTSAGRARDLKYGRARRREHLIGGGRRSYCSSAACFWALLGDTAERRDESDHSRNDGS